MQNKVKSISYIGLLFLSLGRDCNDVKNVAVKIKAILYLTMEELSMTILMKGN